MQKTELQIHILGDKVLRKKSTSIKHVGKQERELIQKMSELMYAEGGIGLAAPQVGINKQGIRNRYFFPPTPALIGPFNWIY